MESVETELLAKLENIFGFQYGKGKKFQDLDTRDFLDVYKIFFRIYDSAWLLKDEKPTATVIKQIHSFLQRMELGHLILKGQDLLDSKKNCRLLGAIVSKLESRHNGVQNILALVRKLRLLKPKSVSDRVNRKQNSASEGSCEDEPVISPELIVPQKGKELPRTPPGKFENCTVVKVDDFLKPKIFVKSPPGVPIKTYSKGATIAVTKKGFRPILPTKEIPRTPLRDGLSDTFHLNHNNPNLTVDFSASRLTSSYTSTPYSAGSTKKSFTADATFVVSPKKSAGAVVESEAKKQIVNETFEDSVFGKDLLTGTYLKEPKKTTEAKTDNMDDSWRFATEDNNGNVEEAMIPSPDAGIKKKPLKESKSNNSIKEKSAKPDVASIRKKNGGADNYDDGLKAKSEPVPENVHHDQETTDAVSAVSKNAKKPKGKKATSNKKDAVEEQVPPSSDPPVAEEPAPMVAETETKKARGKKGKKEAMQNEEAVEEPPVIKGKKARPPKATHSSPTSLTEANKHSEEVEEPTPTAPAPPVVEPESEVVAEAKGNKKGRVKKTNSAAKLSDLVPAVESDKESEEAAKVAADEDVAESSELSAKKGRGKKGSSKEPVKDVPVDKASEQKEDAISVAATAAVPVPEVAESKKKGRGKKNNQPELVQSVADAPPVDVNSEPISDVKEKKGRKAAAKQHTEEAVAAAVEPVETAQSEAVPVVEVKRGRGRLGKAPVEEPIKVDNSNPVAEPKEKKGRGKQPAKDVQPASDSVKAAAAEVDGVEEETKIVEEEKSPVVEVKKGRGRQPKALVEVVDAAVETNQVEEAAAPAKKGRGKKAKAVEEPIVEPEAAEVVQETAVNDKKSTGKQRVEAEEQDQSAKNPKTATKRGKNQVVPVVEDTKADEAAEAPRKSSRNKGEPVKSYDESDSPKTKRGRKPKADVEEAKVADKKKAGGKQKKAEAEAEPVAKVAAPTKRNNKRVNAEEVAEQQKKAASESPEHGPGSRSAESSPAKKNKKDEDNNEPAAEEPEKKSRGRKKKEDPVVESSAAAAVVVDEVEKKKPAGRNKKAPVAVSDQPEPATEPVQSKQRGKRGGQQQQPPSQDDANVFVAFIDGEQSTDTSPTGPPPSKVRRFKLPENATAAVADDVAPVVKRSNRNRK